MERKRDDWQPIETAPKGHDSEILLWAGGLQGDKPHEGRWFSDGELPHQSAGWYWASYSGTPVGPIPATHWISIPEPPAAKEQTK